MIVFPEWSGIASPGGLLWVKAGGVIRLTWGTVRGVMCYTVYQADDPNNPFGAYHVVAECIQDPFYEPEDLDTLGFFRVSVITPDGESEPSEPRAGPGENPGDPTPFENVPLDVEEECPEGGGTFYYTVPAGMFTAWSQFAADTLAFAAAQDLALANMICLDDILPDACANDEYAGTITATGGDPDSWLISAGQLPPGLTLFTDILSPQIATIEDTPTEGGLYGFTARCADSDGNYVERGYQVKIIEITNPAALPDGQGDYPYSLQMTQAGGVSPLTWQVVDGALPNGLTLDPDDGTLTGTPLAGGTFEFTVAVTDGESLSCTKDFTLFINATVDFTVRAGFAIILGGNWSVHIDGVFKGNGAAPNSWALYMNPLIQMTNMPVGQSFVVMTTHFGGGYGPNASGIQISDFGAFQCYINDVLTPGGYADDFHGEKPPGYARSWTVRFEYA